MNSRIVWINLLERKDFLIKKGNKCLSADDIGLRVVASMGIGLMLLFLRIVIFGIPYMSDRMLSSTSLTIAGCVMYWPLYILASMIALVVCGIIQKRKIEKELKEVSEQIEAYRLCF